MCFNLDNNNNNNKNLFKISFSKLTVFYTGQNYRLNVLYEVNLEHDCKVSKDTVFSARSL